MFVANPQAKGLLVIEIATGEVRSVELGHIGGRAVAFTSDARYALVSVETVSEIAVIELATLRQTRHIPATPGPRGPAGGCR